MIQSQKMLAFGLGNYLGGSDFNFRYQTNQKDYAEHVNRMVARLNHPVKIVYTGQQVHGHQISYCDGYNGDDFVVGKQFPATDGLITDQVGVGLLIKFADCTPILFYDPIKKVQALVHSGWRSTVQQIGPLAIERMVSDFACRREDIHAFIGPSIDQDNYEVGEEVFAAFSEISDRDTFFKPGRVSGKYYLSMSQANLALIMQAGITPQNIEVSHQSTFNDERLHSARREGNDYGLNGLLSVIL